MTQAQGKQRALWTALASALPSQPHSPPLSLRALPASVILPANPIPDQRPRRKKGKRRERIQRSEKGEIDMHVAGRVERERE